MKWLALLALLGCKQEAPRSAPLRLHMEAEPPTLNPLVEHDAWTTWLALDAFYDPLVRQDPATAALSPGLALRWQQPDERTVILTLRRGVKWHDGKPFSATDVLATLARLHEPGIAAELQSEFADLEPVERVGDDTVILHFRRPDPLALSNLSQLPILPAHQLAAGDLRMQPLARTPVGTGPFRFLEWRTGESIRLARNERYWGAPAQIAEIELRIVRDAEAAWELARRGEIDLLWRLSPAQADRAALPPGFHVHRWHLPSYSFVVWNLQRPGLGDVRVRQALALAADRARYLKVAFHGRARPITGPYPLDSPSYDRTVAGWPHDPVRARRLLDEAGIRGDGLRRWKEQPFRLTFLLLAGSQTLTPLATMLQEDLRRVGVELEIVPVDWATLLDRLRKHDFDAAALQWMMRTPPDNSHEFHSSESAGGQNYGSFRNAEVDQLIDQLKHTAPGPARVALDHQLHQLLDREQPYLFLGCPEIHSLVAERLHGYAPSAAGLSLARLSVSP